MQERHDAGADTGASMIEHEACEGGVELTEGDGMRVPKAGDAGLFDSRAPHWFRDVPACIPPCL